MIKMLSLQCDVNTAESLQGLRNRQELCDVVIVSGDGRQTLAHSCVLASHSSVLATVLQSRLAAEHDWSILRPLIINVDEVSVKDESKPDPSKEENIVEILISLMYGEIVHVSSALVPLLNEYAHVLGLSDQIFTCLDGKDGKHTAKAISSSKEVGQTSLIPIQSHSKEQPEQYDHVEDEISLANQIFPDVLSKQVQKKQHISNDSEIEDFVGKDNPDNVLSFSMLCSESQDDDSNESKAWNDRDLTYEKNSSIQNQDCNVIVCKMDQGNSEKHNEQDSTFQKQKMTDGNTCSVTSNSDGVLSITVGNQASANTYCGGTQQLHQPKRQVKKSFICSACDATFQKCGDLVKHVQNMQHFTVQCPLCFIQIEDLEGQRLHFALHDQQLPFFCVYCDQRFRTRAALTMHTPKHMTLKPYVCKECGRGFKWRHALHAHLRTHSSTSRLLCDICGFSSKYVTSFKAHLLQHSGQSFRCPLPTCSFTSNRKTHVNDHLATHSKTRVHQCEVCGHSFSHARNMRRHMRLHAPASHLLTCTSLSKIQCNFRTTRLDKLRYHLFKKHNIKPDSLPTQQISKFLKASSFVPSDHPTTGDESVTNEYLNEDSVQLNTPENVQQYLSSPKLRDDSVMENCVENAIEVANISVDSSGNLSFQAAHDICNVKRFDQSSKLDGLEIKGEKLMFQETQKMTKDINVDQNGGEFSLLIEDDIEGLPVIQTLHSHSSEPAKRHEVSEIADNFDSGFLMEHDMLLEKTVPSDVPDTCLTTKPDIHVLQTSVLPMSARKDMSSNSALTSDQLRVAEAHSMDSLTYPSHCTLRETEDNIILEIGDSELSSSNAVQTTVPDSVGDNNFQGESAKDEQCIESLTILDFMLENVTS